MAGSILPLPAREIADFVAGLPIAVIFLNFLTILFSERVPVPIN
jgi:hypothetical protein